MTIIMSMVADATEEILMEEAMPGLDEAMEEVDMVMIETTTITEVDRALTTRALTAEESAEEGMDTMTETGISEAMREKLLWSTETPMARMCKEDASSSATWLLRHSGSTLRTICGRLETWCVLISSRKRKAAPEELGTYCLRDFYIWRGYTFRAAAPAFFDCLFRVWE